MELGPNAVFIVTAYSVTILIVAAMIAWVVLDHLWQRRTLNDLEIHGVTRRSDRTSEGKD